MLTISADAASPYGDFVGVQFTIASTTPEVPSGGVISASAFGGFSSISAGSWIEIYGSSLAADSRGWGVQDFSGIYAPTILDGTSVSIGGKSAFIAYISPGQVNALVSSDTPTGVQPLIVTTASGTSATYNVTVATVEPGLLAPSSFNLNGIQYAVAILPDGTFALPVGAIAGVTSRPALPGEIVTLYGVGFGPTLPDSPAGQLVQELDSLALSFQCAIGGAQTNVMYDGLAPSLTGLYQFNIVIPDLIAGATAPLTFTLNGASGAQTLYIAVGN